MKLTMHLSPEEMADKLISEMGKNTIDRSCYHCTDDGDFTGDIKRHRGRKCALVSVNKTIEAFMYFCADNPETDGEKSFLEYWQKVKDIIEKEKKGKYD